MSLNNLCFPPQLLAELYSRVLVEGFVQPAPTTILTPFLGGNQKKILIVVNEVSFPFLSNDNRAFLEKVLSGCALTIADVVIINKQTLKAERIDLTTQFAPQKMLLLDVDAVELSLPAAEVYVVSEADNMNYLVAPSLNIIQASQHEKRRFWTALKQFFCL